MSSVSAADAGTVRLGDRIVRRLGLGTNRLTDTDAARFVLRRAVDLGVNFVDTADVYQSHASERTIGATLGSGTLGVVIATKGGMTRTSEGFGQNGRPEHLRQALRGSLERLRVDRIELYQLHRVDPTVPIETSVRALLEMKEGGLIRQIGLSNVTVEELQRAMHVAPIVSVQNRYNLLERQGESVLDFCERHSIVFIPWTPLVRGNLSSATTLSQMAIRYEATPHQLALRWLLHRSPMVLPIPGTLSIPHLEENLAAARIDLRESDVRVLSELGRPAAGADPNGGALTPR
jgi:pyridoxine 4-dehydrogenase